MSRRSELQQSSSTQLPNELPHPRYHSQNALDRLQEEFNSRLDLFLSFLG